VAASRAERSKRERSGLSSPSNAEQTGGVKGDGVEGARRRGKLGLKRFEIAVRRAGRRVEVSNV
jgi:hypothetical protein